MPHVVQIPIHVHVDGQDASFNQVAQNVNAFLLSQQLTVSIWLKHIQLSAATTAHEMIHVHLYLHSGELCGGTCHSGCCFSEGRKPEWRSGTFFPGISITYTPHLRRILCHYTFQNLFLLKKNSTVYTYL
jgi:hypothetical protein